jgi:DNA-binding CsgD family transcriptional regulator
MSRFRRPLPMPALPPSANATGAAQDRLSPNARRLLRKLSDGHRLTTAEAADYLDVSARTIRNLRAELEDAGIPVQRAREGHATQLYLRPEDQGHYVEPLHLTERQMEALTVAINAAAHVLAPTPYHAPPADRLPGRAPRVACPGLHV